MYACAIMDAWKRTWPAYVAHHSHGQPPKTIAENVGVDAGTVRRWLATDGQQNQPRVEGVVAFARAYKRNAAEALIEAGYLTEADVGGHKVIERGLPLAELSADDLLNEVRRRIPEPGAFLASGGEVDNARQVARRVGRLTGNDSLQESGESA